MPEVKGTLSVRVECSAATAVTENERLSLNPFYGGDCLIKKWLRNENYDFKECN